MRDISADEPRQAVIRGSVFAVLLCVGLTGIRLVLEHQTGITEGAAGSLYLIAVGLCAIRWGWIPGLVATVLGGLFAAFFFYEPIYAIDVSSPAEIMNLVTFLFVALAITYLAVRLKNEMQRTRQREVDMRDLYAFSRRLALAFDVSDIHAAIEEHLASVVGRKVVLFASGEDAARSTGRRAGIFVPESVRAAVVDIASAREEQTRGAVMVMDGKNAWLVQAVSQRTNDFGIVAVHLGDEGGDAPGHLRMRVDAVLADATATLERLGVAHAISEARMRSQTDRLREAMIGSVSHELRTPLASIMGAATVIGSAPALNGEEKLKALIYDVRNEAERLNQDIQNLLDASRISSNGISPRAEWADVADIVNSAVARCERRLSGHQLKVELGSDLPLIHVDPVLIQQALIQIIDNAVKYSAPGSMIVIGAEARDGEALISVTDSGEGLTSRERERIWDRFFRGERHLNTTSGSGLGLWIASSFVSVNEGRLTADSPGIGRGTRMSISLPVKLTAANQLESEADE